MKKNIAIMILAVGFYSCGYIIEVENISTDSVVLVAPSNNAVLSATDLNFSWEPIIYADNYQIQIATPNFDNPLQILIDSTLTGNHLAVNLEENGYEWRVRAKNSGYETNYSRQSFTVEK